MIAFAAGDLPAVQTAAYGYFYTLYARLGHFGKLLLYGPSVRYALFELRGHRFGHQLCVLIDLVDLFNVDYDALAARKLGKILFDDLDFRAGLADKHAGTARVDGHFYFVGRSYDEYLGDGGFVILLFKEAADNVIFLELLAEIFLFGVPLSAPGGDNAYS